MPVIFEKQIDTAKKLAVWHITESDQELFKIYNYLPNGQSSAKRNREMAVSRILLNYLLGYHAHINLIKDKFGKPILDNSDIALSFSHSQQMVACIIDLEGRPVGIDIEKMRERIKLLSDKFCTDNDHTGLEENKHYHVVWGGKEVLFKIFSRKELDFRKNLSVKFRLNEGEGVIRKNGHDSTHHLSFELIDDYMLVWGYSTQINH